MMKISQENGWSVLELIIVVSIFTLVGLALLMLYSAGTTLMQVSQNKLQLQQQCRLSLDRVLKELRLARPGSISIGASGNSMTFQIPQTINANSGVITWSPAVTYSVVSSNVGTFTNNQLMRTQPGSADIVMANDINNNAGDPNRLLFSGNQAVNPSLITIRMSMIRITTKGNPAVATLTGQVKVRNP